MPHDVFISYSSHDKAVADAVCATLEGHKIRCWIAPRDVLAGISYGESLIEALNGSRIMVLVFSSSSNNSPQVLREMERAASKGIPIVPFRIEDVPLSKAMEYFISSPHWLDALTPPLEKHIQNLAETVKVLLLRTPAHVPVGKLGTHAAAVSPKDEHHEFVQETGSNQPRRFVRLKFLGYAALLIGVCAAYFVFSPNRNQSKRTSNATNQIPLVDTRNESSAPPGFVEVPIRPTNQNDAKPVAAKSETASQSLVLSPLHQNESSGKNNRTSSPEFTRRVSLGIYGSFGAGALSPNGKKAVVGVGDATATSGMILFDTTVGTRGDSWFAHRPFSSSPNSPPASALAFSALGGNMLAAAAFEALTNISVFDDLSHPPRVLKGHTQEVTSVAFAPDGETLASGSRDTTIKLWNPQSGTVLHTLANHERVVSCLAFSPDGETLASGSHDKTVRLWEVRKGKPIRTLTGHGHWVKTVAFSSDGKTLVSGSTDRTVRVWDVAAGEWIQSFPPGDNEVTCVTFAPKSNVIAFNMDKTILLWNTRTGIVCTHLVGHTNDVIALAFTADSQLISLSKDKTAILWDVRGLIERYR